MRLLEQSIFWEIFYSRQLKRTDLARCFQVSGPTISRSADLLIDTGLLIEADLGTASRGRRPALLRVKPDMARFGGIEVDRNRITSVVTDMTGDLLGRCAASYEPAAPPAAILRLCQSTLREALEDAGLHAAQLNGIGLGCAAWARRELQRGLSLSSVLQEEFQTPVAIDDRARAVALGHHILGPDYSSHGNAVYIYAGTGIGAGLFINGRLYRGADLAAGEVGHIVIDRNGPLCSCGKRGCVEAFASTGAVLARFQGMLAGTLSVPETAAVSVTLDRLIGEARMRDPRACQVLQEAGEALGTGVANMIQILNPSLVVLTGSFIHQAGPLLADPVIRTLNAVLLPSTSKRLKICVAPFKKDVIPVGCALLAACDIGPALVRHALEK